MEIVNKTSETLAYRVTAECPDCAGFGVVRATTPRTRNLLLKGGADFDTCRHCGGSGVVEVEGDSDG